MRQLSRFLTTVTFLVTSFRSFRALQQLNPLLSVECSAFQGLLGFSISGNRWLLIYFTLLIILQSTKKIKKIFDSALQSRKNEFWTQCYSRSLETHNQLMDLQEKNPQAGNQLKAISEEQKQKDLTYFDLVLNTSDNNFIQEHHFALDNWEAFAPFSQKSIQHFQDIAAKRLLIQKTQSVIFPTLDDFLQQAETINEYKGNKIKIDSNSLITDRLYDYYIEGLSEKVRRHGVLHFISSDGFTKKPLDESIAHCQEYQLSESKDSRWQRILKKTSQKLTLNSEVDEEMMREYLSEIERERLPLLECIGCSPFFYSNCNIYAPGINSTPIIPLPSISKIKELEGQLKSEVCCLLNTNGGVILFDCIKRNRDIIPVGTTMSPKLKGQYEQKVISYLLGIYPPLKAQNYFISFVPIVRNPVQSRKKEERRKVMEGSTYESTWNERQYIEEVYVLRIKVEPTVGESLYFWINDSRPIMPIKTQSKMSFIQGKHIRKTIKKRFKQYYISQSQDSEQIEQELFLKPRLSYFHKGQCIRADIGVQVAEKKVVGKDQLESKYPNMSILMAKRSEHQAIVKKLREKGIVCDIEYKFQQYKFRYLLTAAVLYHKMRFDLLLNTIQHKEEFEFAGRYTIILKITDFIKLVDRNASSILSEIDFKYYQDFFKKEYPNERPIIWKYNTGSEVEFYCQGGNKSKNLFLYCLMNENNERVAFKNPKNYDKLTVADINERFTLFYPIQQAAFEAELKANLKTKEKK